MDGPLPPEARSCLAHLCTGNPVCRAPWVQMMLPEGESRHISCTQGGVWAPDLHSRRGSSARSVPKVKPGRGQPSWVQMRLPEEGPWHVSCTQDEVWARDLHSRRSQAGSAILCTDNAACRMSWVQMRLPEGGSRHVSCTQGGVWARDLHSGHVICTQGEARRGKGTLGTGNAACRTTCAQVKLSAGHLGCSSGCLGEGQGARSVPKARA